MTANGMDNILACAPILTQPIIVTPYLIRGLFLILQLQDEIPAQGRYDMFADMTLFNSHG